MVNNRETEKERQERTSNELKAEGNKHFKAGRFAKAKQLYTSAICEHDQNPVLFVNRAQAENQLGEHFAGTIICNSNVKE